MKLENVVKDVDSLVSLPAIALRVMELIGQPSTDNKILGELIAHDPALTARLLKLVNSAYFSVPRQVDSVSQAITLIGHKELRNLVMATSAVAAFDGIATDLVDMGTFWRNSVTCGLICRLLAKRRQVADSEPLFIAGLLHKVGKLVMYGRYPETSMQVLQFVDEGEAAMTEAEHRFFGFDHATLGAALLRHWNFPAIFPTLIEFHLHPGSATEFQDETALLHVAALITAGVEPETKPLRAPDALANNCDPGAWKRLGLQEAEVDELVSEANREAFEVLQIIRPSAAINF
jgi:HD-like signal output (HDOD) protein